MSRKRLFPPIQYTLFFKALFLPYLAFESVFERLSAMNYYCFLLFVHFLITYLSFSRLFFWEENKIIVLLLFLGFLSGRFSDAKLFYNLLCLYVRLFVRNAIGEI